MAISDNLISLGKTIAKYGAPLLGTAIGGPAGGAIASIIASEFGGNVDDTPDLIQKIISDPNAAAKILEIQNNAKVQLQQIAMQMAENDLKYDTQQKEIDFQNTKNARETNAITKSIMPEMMSFIIMVGFFGCIYWVAAFPQDQDDAQVLYMLLGTMSTAFGSVINYWLGSSSDSRNKTNLLNRRATDPK